jgi:hypothetical protein
MSADSKDKLATISPAVLFQFEKTASWTCDEAKVDDADRPYQIREWVGAIEQKFRCLVADGKTPDEDAALVAIALFNPRNVAKQRRGRWKGFWYRLLNYRRYSAHRLVAPVAFGMLHAWYRTSGSLQISVLGDGKGPSMVLFGWNYYVGIFTVAIIVLERFLIRFVRVPRMIAEGLAGGATLLIFLAIAYEWVGSASIWVESLKDRSAWAGWLDFVAGTDYLFGYLIEALLFLIIFRLVFVEIFDLPERRREQMALRRLEN